MKTAGEKCKQRAQDLLKLFYTLCFILILYCMDVFCKRKRLLCLVDWGQNRKLSIVIDKLYVTEKSFKK